MLETCDPLDLHLRLPQIQYVDFRTDMEAAGHRLLAVWGIRSRREELAYEYSEHKTYQEVRDHVARLSGYSLLRTLGQGEISHAFLARSETLGVPVVIKVVTANLGEPWRTMVRETAEKLLDVRHPAVVTTYAVIEKGKFLSIVTEYVDGFTLDKVMSSIGTPAQACNMMADVAEALDFVHRRGILHNHLKPSNILVDREGRPHVLDFGPHPPSGVILGSPTYVPPERIRGNRSDPRSDIWVCGVLLYEMLTGQRPFDTGESDFETRQPMAESKPRPLRDWNPSIPRDIEKICLRCLACDPQQRYPSAGDLAAALRGGAQMCDRPSG
jgi:serine/threonine protein kinase